MIRELELPVVAVDGNRARANRPSMWYINPSALLLQLCTINAALFGLIKNAVGSDGTKVLRVVLYFDGVNPGNPLAPDPQKLLQAIRWCFVDLPNWFLRRKDSWFCFSLVRETWAKQLPGEMNELCKIVMGLFFSAVGDSSHKGIMRTCGSESLVVMASFAGDPRRRWSSTLLGSQCIEPKEDDINTCPNNFATIGRR